MSEATVTYREEQEISYARFHQEAGDESPWETSEQLSAQFRALKTEKEPNEQKQPDRQKFQSIRPLV